MAENMLGRNVEFKIFVDVDGEKTSFHGLVLHKSVVDSVVMSLGDKITGDVYYKDNTLDVSMKEYIEYKRDSNNENEEPVRYVLINPPTVVREGLVSDNSGLNGMTKYSFEFYHPMCLLSNLPFSDVAVTPNEKKYLSQNKTFSWIGKPQDFINKLNKNLEGTQWVVAKSSKFPQDKDDKLSDVLRFDKNTVAEAIKVGHDTWDVPFVVSKISGNNPLYAQGKRFLVEYGLPSNEIYENSESKEQGEPFVFKFGQGVGLKNNSRTPRNNKIVTRISGYGSEDNIPYGYPQIRWYGDSRWEYTRYINDDPMIDASGKPQGTPSADAYPLYMGIVGGEYVKLIKHPFTRSTLMPSIYSETVFNKVSPYLADGSPNPHYDTNAEIVDYYDAVYSEKYPYAHEVDVTSPSYDMHEFEDIKPELEDGSPVAITNAVPLNSDLSPASSWDDTMDDDGNYKQSYFKMTLPKLDFDLYACAAITQEMNVNMRSGACIGCTFQVQVDWDDYKNNFYDENGNFLPDGAQRDLEKYPKSDTESIDIIVQKELSTFGTLMPNIYQQPKNGDSIVFIGISLPLSYISNAEVRLDDAMKSYMLHNNVYYYDYPLKFDEYFLATHTYILRQIQTNSIIHFEYANERLELFVKQLTVKYGEKALPQYDITLTDNIEVVLNQIGQVSEDVEHLSTMISMLRQTYSRNVWAELARKLSKTDNDTAQGIITFANGLISNMFAESTNFREGLQFGSGWKIWNAHADNNKSRMEIDDLHVRGRLTSWEIEIMRRMYSAGCLSLGYASAKSSFVVPINDSLEPITEPLIEPYAYRVYFKRTDGETTIDNLWLVGDLARCREYNVESHGSNVGNRAYWRLIIGVGYESLEEGGEEYNFIDLSNVEIMAWDVQEEKFVPWDATTHSVVEQYFGYEIGSDTPISGDEIVQEGNVLDSTRQDLLTLALMNVGGGEDGFNIFKGAGADRTSSASQFRWNNHPIHIGQKNASMVVDSLLIRTGGSSEGTPVYVNKGDWTVGTTAYANELWRYDGNIFLCSAVNGTTDTPSEASSVWSIYLAKGADGQKGADGKTFTMKGSVRGLVDDTTELQQIWNDASAEERAGLVGLWIIYDFGGENADLVYLGSSGAIASRTVEEGDAYTCGDKGQAAFSGHLMAYSVMDAELDLYYWSDGCDIVGTDGEDGVDWTFSPNVAIIVEKLSTSISDIIEGETPIYTYDLPQDFVLKCNVGGSDAPVNITRVTVSPNGFSGTLIGTDTLRLTDVPANASVERGVAYITANATLNGKTYNVSNLPIDIIVNRLGSSYLTMVRGFASLGVMKGDLIQAGINLDGNNKRLDLVGNELRSFPSNAKMDDVVNGLVKPRVVLGYYGNNQEPELSFYNPNTNKRQIRFGIVDNVVVMEYYDSDGRKLYDLGPNGLAVAKTQDMEDIIQQMTNVTANVSGAYYPLTNNTTAALRWICKAISIRYSSMVADNTHDERDNRHHIYTPIQMGAYQPIKAGTYAVKTVNLDTDMEYVTEVTFDEDVPATLSASHDNKWLREFKIVDNDYNYFMLGCNYVGDHVYLVKNKQIWLGTQSDAKDYQSVIDAAREWGDDISAYNVDFSQTVYFKTIRCFLDGEIILEMKVFMN